MFGFKLWGELSHMPYFAREELACHWILSWLKCNYVLLSILQVIKHCGMIRGFRDFISFTSVFIYFGSNDDCLVYLSSVNVFDVYGKTLYFLLAIYFVYISYMYMHICFLDAPNYKWLIKRDLIVVVLFWIFLMLFNLYGIW